MGSFHGFSSDNSKPRSHIEFKSQTNSIRQSIQFILEGFFINSFKEIIHPSVVLRTSFGLSQVLFLEKNLVQSV